MPQWPASLPTWKLPLSHKADEGVLRTNMSVGPAKLRKRYSAVPTQFQTTFWCNGIQQQILQGFYNQNQASEFERIDPVTGDTQYFRFLTSPEFRTRVGAELPSERQYEVTLSLERMPGSPDKAFTVLLDGDYANPLINFTRNSPGWYFGSDGLLKEVAANEMRMEYDPATGEPLGLLIEESRTNSIVDSRDMTTASWVESNVTVAADQVGIDGVSNSAFTITKSGISENDRIQQPISVTDTNQYTASLYVKWVDADVTAITVRLTTLFRASINWDGSGGINSVTDAFGNLNSVDFEEIINGFFRIWFTFTADETTTAIFEINPDRDNPAGTQSVISDQAQFEQGSFPSSPIVTGGTTVTRSADVPKDTDLSWYNQSEGTFVVEAEYSGRDSGNPRIITTEDATAAYMAIDAANLDIESFDGSTINTQPDTITKGMMFKAAMSLSVSDNERAIVLNGGTVSTGVLNDTFSLKNPTQIQICPEENSVSFNGHIRSLHYYPNRLSNAKLQELTR